MTYQVHIKIHSKSKIVRKVMSPTKIYLVPNMCYGFSDMAFVKPKFGLKFKTKLSRLSASYALLSFRVGYMITVILTYQWFRVDSCSRRLYRCHSRQNVRYSRTGYIYPDIHLVLECTRQYRSHMISPHNHLDSYTVTRT